MNTSSLTCKGKAQRLPKCENMIKLSYQKCSVYRCTFVMQHQSNVAQMVQHTKCARKSEEKGGKERQKRGKMGDQIAKIKKKHLHAHTFSHRDPCAMTFRECEILAVLDCEE